MDQFRILKVLAAMDDVDANQACVDQGLTSYGTLTGKGHKLLKQSRQSGVPYESDSPFVILAPKEPMTDDQLKRFKDEMAKHGSPAVAKATVIMESAAGRPFIINPLTSAQLTLALMRLKCWATRKGEDGEEVESNVRAATQFTYGDLEALHNAGLVEASVGTKTARLTDEGVKVAEGILAGVGVPVPEIVVREV